MIGKKLCCLISVFGFKLYEFVSHFVETPNSYSVGTNNQSNELIGAFANSKALNKISGRLYQAAPVLPMTSLHFFNDKFGFRILALKVFGCHQLRNV